MSVILLALGILLTGIGVVVVGFGVPINESALGQTLIIAGATALVGGPILIGLGAAVAQLAQIAEGLKGTRPAAAARTGRVAAAVQRAEEPEPRPTEVRLPEPRVAQPRAPQPRPAEPRLPEPGPAEPVAPEPARAADSTVAVSASAIERLRSTMARPDRPADDEDVPLSPNGGQHAPESVPEPRPVEAAPEPKAAAVDTKEPRLDFLFRSRPAPPARRESFDAMWPKRGGAAEQPKLEEARPSAGAPAPAEEPRRATPPRPAPPPEEQRPSVAILKSGVVDGMAYTLYADGSIEAQLPQGTVRFGSIAELRAHIENNS